MTEKVKKETPWEKFKKNNPEERTAKPWDLLTAAAKTAMGSKNQFVPVEIKESRMKTCRDCEHFQEKTVTCGICHCFLPGKTSLPHSFCPIKKWDVYEFEESNGS